MAVAALQMGSERVTLTRQYKYACSDAISTQACAYFFPTSRSVLCAGWRQIEPEAYKFVNRLSDYFFTAARYAAQFENKEETIFKPTR